MPNNYRPPPAMRLYPSSCLDWNGRLTFPFRETAAASPSEQIIKAGESPRLDRSGLEVPGAKNARDLRPSVLLNARDDTRIGCSVLERSSKSQV